MSGLVKGSAKGYFKLILRRLKDAGYRVEARLLDASWLGVPQSRQRLIFVGVREDLPAEPAFPTPVPWQYTVRDALPWIAGQGDNGPFGGGAIRSSDAPSPTIGAGPQTGNGRFPASLVEARVVHDTSGMYRSGDVTDKPCPAITVGGLVSNACHYQVHGTGTPGPVYDEQGVPHDPETGTKIGLSAGKPDRDGHLIERRKLTLRELRSIGGFPPDFELTGSYGQRWERIGRAVPPVMMAHVAAAVRDRILVPLREQGVI